MAERITKYHPIGLEGFQSIWTNNFKIQNLYVKNIIFAYSLPTSTSTWHSNHRNGPGGYMSGELKSEKIKYRKALLEEAIIQQQDLQLPHYIQPSYRKIFILYTRLLHNTRKTLKPTKTIQLRPSLINKTLTDCCLYLNAITTDDLKYSLREAAGFKIITCYYSSTSRESPREVINSLCWNYYFSFLFFGNLELPYYWSQDYPQLIL
jgi:hypothetical protein